MEQLPEGFVLDEDTEAQSSALPEGFVLDSDDPMESQGIFEKGAKALQYGAAQRAVGYGKTLDAVGADSAGRSLVEMGQAIAPDDYRPATQDFFDPQAKDRGLMGYGWSYAPRALLEQVPGLAADLGVSALTGPIGFIASNAGANFGPTLEARTQNDGRTMEDATVTDYAVAGAGTVANAALNRLGIAPALSSSVKGAGLKALAQVPLALGKAAVAEGVTESAQTAVDQAATQIGTERGYDPNLKEIAGAGFLGAAAGGSIRATGIPGDVVNSVRDMSYDPESATRVADYVKSVDEKLGTEKGEYNALRTTKQHFESQYTEARKGANEYIKEQEAGAFLSEVDNRLKHGYTLKDGDYEQLTALFSERGDGAALINAIKDRDTVNRLASRGTVTDGEQRFGGGLSGGKLGRFINPSRNVGRFLATAGAGTAAAGQLAIPFASQIALASPMVAKVLASQAGGYAAARGVDSVLGTSHPMRRFADRWSGVAETRNSGLPTTKDLKAAQAALKKLQAEEDRIFTQAERGGSGRSTPDAARQSKQAEKAWSQHQKFLQTQESALDARRADEDAAWSQHTAMPKNASEDALWAEHERSQQQESQADAEAQDGISEGVRAMLEKAVKSGQAQRKLSQDAEAKKAADYERGLKQKAAQEAEEARKRQEMEKAYSQNQGSLPKQASEDALWAEYQKMQEADQARALEELAGINAVEAMNRQDQMNVVAQALNRLTQVRQQKAQDFDRGRSQAAAQDAQAAKVSQARDAEFQKADKARRAPTPEEIKAQEEEAAWSQYQQDQDEDWSDADAEKAIEAELKKRDSESKRVVSESKKAKDALEKLKKKTEEAASKPKPGEMPKVQPNKDGTKKLSERALEKLQAVEEDGEFYVTKRGVQEARIPKKDITHSPQRWKNRTQQRFEVREDFVSELKKAGGKSVSPDAEALLARLSNTAKNWKQAQDAISDFIDSIKNDKIVSDLWDVVNDWQGAVQGTYEKND